MANGWTRGRERGAAATLFDRFFQITRYLADVNHDGHVALLGEFLCRRFLHCPYWLTPISSTSKISVALGGITPPAPRAP